MHLASGIYTTKGSKEFNEDVAVRKKLSKGIMFYGVMDGHGKDIGAKRSAEFVGKSLPGIIKNNLTKRGLNWEEMATARPVLVDGELDLMKQAINDSFCEVDKILYAKPKIDTQTWLPTFLFEPNIMDFHQSGCCAAVSIVMESVIVLANVGDSRAFVGGFERTDKQNGGEPVVLFQTSIHTVHVESERQRILNLGGNLNNNRLNGSLIPTRGFADFRFKNIKDPSTSVLSCLPDVSFYSRNSSEYEEYLVIGSDGIFDVLSMEDILKMIRANVDNVSLEKISKMIVTEAIQRGSRDNCTICIVDLESGNGSSEASSIRSLSSKKSD